jgi:hypothetical protein
LNCDNGFEYHCSNFNSAFFCVSVTLWWAIPLLVSFAERL